MCVVAYARRDMSKKIRSINGYRNPEMCYLYTDTDSMIMKKCAFDKLPSKFIGKNLGQFEDEFPNDKIISFRALAPKTYCLALLLNKGVEGFTIGYKVRCKGIPHTGGVIEARTFPTVKKIEEVLDIVYEEVNNIRDKYYILHDVEETPESDSKATIIPFIDIDVFDFCLFGTHTVTCYYGTMIKSRSFGQETKQYFSIKTMWATRRLVFDIYWMKEDCDRIFKEDNKLAMRNITLCRGSELTDEMTIGD